MKTFKTLDQMIEAIKNDELPKHIISPGAAAAALGVSRQAIHERCKCGSLPCWYAERVILIDAKAVQKLAKERQGIHESQGEMYATK